MPTTIVSFYIECADQGELEKVLHQAGYAFYDATDRDFHTRPNNARRFPTLESIEAHLEDK